MIESLLIFVIWAAVLGLVFWLVLYLVNTIPVEPVRTIVRIVLMIVMVLVLVYLLIGILPPLRPLGLTR